MVKIIQPSLTPEQLTFIIDAINYAIVSAYKDAEMEDRLPVNIVEDSRAALVQTYKALGDGGYGKLIEHLMLMGKKAQVDGLFDDINTER